MVVVPFDIRHNEFLACDAMLARYMLTPGVGLSVCSSVCLSATSRSSAKMVKPSITQTTPNVGL